MIRIKVGILLAIPLKPEHADTEPAEGKGKKKKEEKKSAKKPPKKSSKPEKPKKSPPPKPPHVYDVGKPLGYFNIQYALFPNTRDCSIDVIYWKHISKIFVGNDIIMYRHCTINGNIWIPIMVQHKFKELSIQELLELHKYSFKMAMTAKKNKVGNKAKMDKSKTFYIKQSDLENLGIIEAFDSDPNIEPIELKKNVEKTEMKAFLFEKDIIYPRMLKIMRDLDGGKTISVKYYIPNTLESLPENCETFHMNEVEHMKWQTGKKGKGKEGGKGKSTDEPKKTKTEAEKNKPSTFGVNISGEAFFTDPCLSVYKVRGDGSDLDQAFVLFSVHGLMTDAEKTELNPLVIKLVKVSGIPDDLLKRENFSSVWLQYNIPDIGRTTTQKSEIKKKILFNESHAYFYVPNNKLLQFCQTQRLRVELVGAKEKDELDPKLFGKICGDCYFKADDPYPYLKEKPATVILAVACFDLSLILRPVPTLEVTSPFQHPENMLVQPPTSLCEKTEFINPITANDINFHHVSRTTHNSPIHDYLMLTCGTSLKIEVYTTLPLRPQPQLLMDRTLFKRMLLVIHKEEVAAALLNEVMLHNQNSTVEVILPNYFAFNKKGIDAACEMVSGFCVDSGDSYILFIEAPTINYVFEIIWTQVKKLNENVCKIFHNTLHTFPFRIYEAFLSIGGLLNVSLKVPLPDLFKMQEIHHRSKVPKPCYQALQKLALLLHAQTFRELNHNCLFPTVMELLSFNLEFGVAHRLSDERS